MNIFFADKDWNVYSFRNTTFQEALRRVFKENPTLEEVTLIIDYPMTYKREDVKWDTEE